jgi:hypothetical protein
MNSMDLRIAFEALNAADPETADRDKLSAVIESSSQLRGWLESIDLKCSRRARHLSSAGRSEPAESMNSRQGKRSNKEAKKIADRENVGDAMGDFEKALGDGKVSGEHLDALAAAMRNLDDDLKAKFREREPELLKKALTESVDVFARRCRQIARQLVAKASAGKSDADELDDQRKRSVIKHWVDKITGMHHTHIELDPIRDAQLWSIINAYTAILRQNDGNANTPWSQLQVNAFLAAVEGGLDNGRSRSSGDGERGNSAANRRNDDADNGAGGPGNGAGGTADKGGTANSGRDDGSGDDGSDTANNDGAAENGGNANNGVSPGRRIPEITLLVDWHTLISGVHDHSVCETEDGVTLPVSTVRRLCCDTEVLLAVLDGDGEVLDVGRAKRTATPHQRRALRVMYRTCAHPDCTVGFSACRIHHVKWWWKHLGKTDIDNLLPLCERHHHLVHEGGWGLTMTPDRVTTWTRPDGVIAYTAQANDRAPSGVGPKATSDDRKFAST